MPHHHGRIGTFGAGVATLSLVLATASSTPANANPPARAFGAPEQRALAAPVQGPVSASARRPSLGRHREAMATGCVSNYGTAGYYFVGVPDGTNYAGGKYSAVLGGASNEACDAYSAVGTGNLNVVGYNGSATESFVGGGSSNAITGDNSFVGAGEVNAVTAEAAIVGSGVFNLASAAGSFVGAGGHEYGLGKSPVSGEGNIAGGIDSFVGAGDLNQITSAGLGSFIGGGGTYGAQSSTAGNTISGEDSFIGAGGVNTVAGNDDFVGAGYANAIPAGAWAVVVGGEANDASASDAFVGGGSSNAASGTGAFLGGGSTNKAAATDAFLGAGEDNSISTGGTYAAIAGGYQNAASAAYASVLGGFGNAAKGQYATIAGGRNNTASGEMSFASGYHADAVNAGSFVWSDYSAGSALVKDAKANQFVVRASGGITLYSNEAATSGEELTAGSGTWASLSDRNAKTDIAPLDEDAILASVAALPIDRWSYKSEKGVRHMGPMAQDFYAAFGVGVDDRHITSIDEDGAALAAIKALYGKVRHENGALLRDNSRLHGEVADLQSNFAELAKKVKALSARAR